MRISNRMMRELLTVVGLGVCSVQAAVLVQAHTLALMLMPSVALLGVLVILRNHYRYGGR